MAIFIKYYKIQATLCNKTLIFTLKVLIIIVTNDILIFDFFNFSEKTSLEADSNEMPSLIFVEKYCIYCMY